MPNSKDRKLVQSTSSRRSEHQVERWGCHPTVKNSDPELFLSKRTAGTKIGDKTEGQAVQRLTQLGFHIKDRLQDLTLVLICYACKLEPSMAVL